MTYVSYSNLTSNSDPLLYSNCNIFLGFWKLTAKESRLHKFSQKYFTLRGNSHDFYLSWIYTNLYQYHNMCKRFFDEKGKVKCFTSFFIFFKSQCIYLQYSLNMSNYVQIVEVWDLRFTPSGLKNIENNELWVCGRNLISFFEESKIRAQEHFKNFFRTQQKDRVTSKNKTHPFAPPLS